METVITALLSVDYCSNHTLVRAGLKSIRERKAAIFFSRVVLLSCFPFFITVLSPWICWVFTADCGSCKLLKCILKYAVTVENISHLAHMAFEKTERTFERNWISVLEHQTECSLNDKKFYILRCKPKRHICPSSWTLTDHCCWNYWQMSAHKSHSLL